MQIFKIWQNSFWFSAIASLALVLLFVWQMFRLIDAEQWLDHTDQAISKAVLIEKLMIDAETGIRGYLLSADQRALKPYSEAIGHYQDLLDETLELVKDNPSQQSHLREAAKAFAEWLTEADAISRESESEKVKAYFGIGRGSQLMDLSRQQMVDFLSEEQKMRIDRAKHLHWQIPRAIASGAAISLILRLLISLMMKRLRQDS